MGMCLNGETSETSWPWLGRLVYIPGGRHAGGRSTQGSGVFDADPGPVDLGVHDEEGDPGLV